MTAAEHSAFLLQIVKYVNVASLTILVTDYLQTLELEIELIWRAKWGLVKILFLFARYSTFFDVPLVLYYSLAPRPSNQKCLVIYSIASWSTCFGIEVSEAILVVRTYALSGNSRNILIYLLIQFVVISTAVLVILVIFLRSLRYGTPPLPTVMGCYPTEGSKILFADFVLLMLNETAIMILTLWIGIKRYRHSRNPLIVTLYRDGIFYFIYLFLISAANIVVLVVGPPELIDLVDTFQRVMHSILSTRILLHVRNTGRDREVVAISNLRFGSRPDRRKWYQSSTFATDQSTVVPPTTEENIELE